MLRCPLPFWLESSLRVVVLRRIIANSCTAIFYCHLWHTRELNRARLTTNPCKSWIGVSETFYVELILRVGIGVFAFCKQSVYLNSCSCMSKMHRTWVAARVRSVWEVSVVCRFVVTVYCTLLLSAVFRLSPREKTLLLELTVRFLLVVRVRLFVVVFDLVFIIYYETSYF